MYIEERCEICGGELYVVHKGTRDDQNINVLKCSRCNTKQLSIINDKDYENGFMNGKESFTPEEISKRVNDCKADDDRRVKMLIPICEGCNVLDFGCGFGGVLLGLEDYCKSICGVELSSFERNYLIDKGYDVRKSIDEFGDCFDLITLFHVFEHLNNPRFWLNKIADHLRIGGKCIIEVPNANDALLELYDCKAFSDFTYWSAHLFLYTIDSLESLILENGKFEITKKDFVQRYSLANHLYWLSKGEPGGQKKWDFFNDDIIISSYNEILKKLKYSDTIMLEIKKIKE